MHLDFTDEDYHEIVINLWHQLQPFYFNTDDTMKGLVAKLTHYLGKQPRLPDWLHQGVVLAVQGGTKKVVKITLVKQISMTEIIPTLADTYI